MRLSTVEFVLQQAWTAVKRNGVLSVAAITNIAAVMMVVGTFALAAMNMEHWLGKQAQAAVITVDLADDANPADVEAALLRDERVKKTEYVPRDRNLRELAQKWGLPLENLEYLPNPLPDCIRVTTYRPEDIPEVAAAATRIEGVAEVHYAQKVTQRLLQLVSAAKKLGLGLSIVLVLAALLVVATTIRLTVYARRREIRIMQLVGATHWFIRMPFLIEGAIYGFAGGLIAGVALAAAYSYVERLASEALPFLPLLFAPALVAGLAAGLTGGGVVFGVLGSLIATREYLQEV